MLQGSRKMGNTIGSLIIDVAGKELTAEDRELLQHPLVGGIILFTRNYESREQLTQLCQSIAKARTRPLLIMVDQEGGRVQRFKGDFTTLPPVAEFGRLYDQNAKAGLQTAQEGGYLMASELVQAGIDLSLAPVLDLNKNNTSVIGDRAFHADTNAVTELAAAFMAGMRQAGMSAVAKHFPGHGSVTLDSHKELPFDERALHEVEQSDLQPFAKLIDRGLPAVMAAHIVFSQVDEYPVGYSRKWLCDILRQKMGFKGLIFSDDLTMEGANISAHYEDRVKAAHEAGCDIKLLCNHRAGVIQALDKLPHAPYQLEESRWCVLKKCRVN